MDLQRFYASFSPEALENGKRIFEAGGVTRITRGLSGRFYGTVRDRYVEYRTRVTLSPDGNADQLDCSCPATGFCAHQAAFLTAVVRSLDNNPSGEMGKCLFSDHGFSAICGEYIATASRGRETPALARRITDMGRVDIVTDSPQGDSRRIFARVGGHNRFSTATEETYLTLDSRGLPTHGRCGCMPDGGAFLCEHMAAVLFTLFPEESAPEVVTSDAIHRLIAESRPVQAEVAAPGSLRLVPELTFTFDSRLMLSFLIGRDRLYSVRSISEFLDAVKAGSPLAYGKNCVFDHNLESFDEKSQGYIRFLRSRHASEMPLYGMSASAVYLGENNIDDFFFILGETPVIRNNTETPVVSGDPAFRVLFSPAGRSGCRMTFDGDGLCILGCGEKCYVLDSGQIFVCSRGFTKSVSRLLSDMASAGSDGLLMSGNDLGRFFSRVIRPVRDYVSWRFSDAGLEARLPGELTCRILIRTLGPDSARAEAEFSYGDRVYPVFQRVKDADTRDTALEAKIERAILKYFPIPLTADSAAEIRGDSGAMFRLAREGLDELRALAQVDTENGASMPRVRATGDIRFSLDLSGGLLDFRLESEDYSPRELAQVLSALDRGEKFYRFDDGSFADLSDETFDYAAELFRGLSLSPEDIAQNMKLPLFRMLYLENAARENSRLIDRSGAFRRAANANPPAPEDCGVPADLLGLLRPYQEEGFLWMRSLESRGFGGILADDMGLGKTLQALALVLSSPPPDGDGPVLVVCPTSLVANWAAEIRNFAPELDSVTVYGTASERAGAIEELKDATLGITSYDSLKRDLPYYRCIRFRAVIADEAQYIKNRTTQAAAAVKALSARVKFALTGTPVENSPAELWSIFDYLMPGYLGRYVDFRRLTEQPIADGDKKALLRLRRQTAPFILRRIKRDVLTELPEKTESVLYTRLSGEQKKAYAAVSAALIAELREKLLSGEPEANFRFDVLTMLLRLRQICCHPPLCLGESYSGESAKLELCMDLLDSLKSGGHRVLLFSQFTSMLDVLAQRLTQADIPFFTLTGKTPVAERLELVRRFNSGEGFVFLISLKAGGTGLNLTGADTVIHYDPWWNMAAQNQATDRAHRIGQEHHVHVWRLIAEDTIEQKIAELQEKKAGLAAALIDGSDGSAARLSAEELISLLEN